MSDDTLRTYRDAFGKHSPSEEPGWLRALREVALERFAARGFPTRQDEAWKYTNVSALAERAFPLAPGGGDVDWKGTDAPDLGAARAVFVDGTFAPDLSTLDGLPAGIAIRSIATLRNVQPEFLEPHLGKVAAIEDHPFAALNSAFLNDGAVVHCAPDASCEVPLHLVFVSAAGQCVSHPRVLVVAESGSAVTVVESYVSGNGIEHLVNPVREIRVGEGARVDHVTFQAQSRKSFHISNLAVHQARDSRFAAHSLSFGAGLTRNDAWVSMQGPGAEATLNGLYVAWNRQHVDNYTHIDHAEPNCTSRELYKGILSGSARGVFHGRVVVKPDAQKSNAQQNNKNLLLSRAAEINTKPQLEIYADDVKCTHGSTVGQLDPKQVFYLRSRGIDENQARAMLMRAFAGEITDRLPASVRESFGQFTERRLSDPRLEEGTA